MPKSKIVEVIEAEEPAAEELEPPPEMVSEVGPVAPTAPTSGRKALGGKEVIPFRWKLVGHAAGYALTLFKAVEKEDVEAQLDRVRREGYYQDLQVLDVAAKVEQPKQPKSKPVVEAPKRAVAVAEAPRKSAATILPARNKPAPTKRSAPSKSAPATKDTKSKKQKTAGESSSKHKASTEKSNPRAKPGKKK